MAAPTVVETVAAAPTMVETVAAAPAVTYAAAPTIATTTVAAAPAVTYAAAPTQVASYVAAPQVIQQAPSYVAAPVAAAAVAGPPEPLTKGIPDPASIKSQQDAYAKALEKQYQDGAAAIAAETKVKKEMLNETAKQQKAQYQLQVQSQLQAQNLLLDQQMNSQLMMLQESAMAQRSALEQQAAALTLEWQQKKAEEEMLKKQYEIQRQYCEAENKLATQFNQVVGEEQKAMLDIQQKAAALGVNTG